MEIFTLLNSILNDSGYHYLSETTKSGIYLYLSTHNSSHSSSVESEQNTSILWHIDNWSNASQETKFLELDEENILHGATISNLNECDAESYQSTTDLDIKEENDIIGNSYLEDKEMFNLALIPSEICAMEVVHTCLTCEESFSNESDLIYHQQIHKTSRSYEFHDCNILFTSKNRLVEDSSYPVVEKPHKCEVCNASFRQMSGLTKHLRVHTGEKPYECEVCNASFRQISDLTVHLRVHTGEKPYECEVCSKSFSRISNLSRHYKTHTGEKPYKCNFCGKSYTQNTNLKYHLKTCWGEEPQTYEVL